MSEPPASKRPRRPAIATDPDLAEFTEDQVALVHRLLAVIEEEVVPLTQRGVREGNKLFGGAILKKSDLSTVVAATNREMDNPLFHGEIVAINCFYALPPDDRVAAKDCFFVSTHEPCPLCLSAIAWAGFDNFFYLFNYEDSKKAFKIPHDLRMQEEIFCLSEGNYASKNCYWSSWGIRELIASCDPSNGARFNARVEWLSTIYEEMSKVYQASKSEGSEIPLQ